jgi:hypothetical protein
MAQYPYLVVFATATDRYPYVVRANDAVQAARRGRRMYEADQGENATGELLGRVLDLNPKQVDGKFLPRLNGKVVSSDPYETPQQAIDATLAFLNTRRSIA